MSLSGVVFLDVDHTIIHGSTGRHYIMAAVRRGLFPRRNILSIPRFYLQYRYGGMSTNKPFERDFPGLAGTTRGQLENIARICFETKLRPGLFEEAYRLIQDHKAQGAQVVLATSSIDIIVRPMADWLGVELIASSLEFDGEFCTGRFAGAPAFREEKRRRVLEHIERSGVGADDCWFFSDSIHDLPVLEAVGHPVATNPDRRLKSLARKRGWPVRIFTGFIESQ